MVGPRDADGDACGAPSGARSDDWRAVTMRTTRGGWWAAVAGAACLAMVRCGDAVANGGGTDAGVDVGAGPDAGASSFVGAYGGSYRATRMQTAPSARTTQENEPAYNILMADAGGGVVLLHVTESCSFRATPSGTILSVEVGRRCVGFPGRSGTFTPTGGTAQRDGNELTLTVAGDYATTLDGQATSGLYTWTYTGRPR